MSALLPVVLKGFHLPDSKLVEADSRPAVADSRQAVGGSTVAVVEEDSKAELLEGKGFVFQAAVLAAQPLLASRFRSAHSNSCRVSNTRSLLWTAST